ncbi:unnamed protein product [Ambrosiozyma monospora]|uniref:Unnamed protein product n=1 Tax=Ambrosiozyma monospora TaxID=43982 RepID=A0ACB5U8F5_AMBMO|nr:unnamed protein product [Ambrosiozyma monospora]
MNTNVITTTMTTTTTPNNQSLAGLHQQHPHFSRSASFETIPPNSNSNDAFGSQPSSLTDPRSTEIDAGTEISSSSFGSTGGTFGVSSSNTGSGSGSGGSGSGTGARRSLLTSTLQNQSQLSLDSIKMI